LNRVSKDFVFLFLVEEGGKKGSESVLAYDELDVAV